MKAVIFGRHDTNTLNQLDNCMTHGNVVGGALCADGHYGYAQPVGGVIAYDKQISPSGVGYDIACGNKAIKTNLKLNDVKSDLPKILDSIQKEIPFGIGKKSHPRNDHAVFSDPLWEVFKEIGQQEHDTLLATAKDQLGTAGSGNHYIDLLVDLKTDEIWLANHFGSRGLGHKTATGFLNLAHNRAFDAQAPRESMDSAPTILDIDSELGSLYFDAMTLAGKYAYAGRDVALNKALDIVGGKSLVEVHNHHNYAWKETHFGKESIVVRKGATPAAPGQLGFVGGSMADISVILEGVDSQKSRDAFYSTVHGAGRVMSRTQAAGKMNWRTRQRRGGKIDPKDMQKALKDYGVELRGGGVDESPFVYRKLKEVLKAHAGTIKIRHTLKPIGVVMAGD